MRLTLLIAVIALSGCQSEPDFDERYAATEKQLREKAKQIDSELAKRKQAADTPPGSERAKGEAKKPKSATND